MSSQIGQASLSPSIVPDDVRLWALAYSQLEVEVYALDGYANPYWPGGAQILGCSDAGDLFEPREADRGFEATDQTRGHNYRFGVIGVTRDVYGSPLGGVTVKLFRTSTDELVHNTVSDPSGNYAVSTPFYGEGHYIVTYKTGAPDVFGSSPNNLTGV